MIRTPDRLAEQPFDLLIVGGGIVGAGIAWDASLRGLSCALVDQGDFASGTSSKTTKLIHGGLRYLESLDFKLVQESLREREVLLSIAPHIIRPLPFLIPVKGRSPRPWPIIKLGVTLYDWLAGRSRLPRHQFLDSSQLAQTEPLLAGDSAQHGVVYYDAQMKDARLVIDVMQAASAAGAIATNYVKVIRWLTKNGRLVGAELEDRITAKRYTVKAQVCINATGPWVDRLRQMANPNAAPIVRPAKGIHLIYPNLGLRQAILLSSGTDGRIFFVIPWEGLTLIGTTDTDYKGDPSDAQADAGDVNYLIEQTNRYLPKLQLEKSKVISTFAGVRPLVAQDRKNPSAVSRTHLLHEDSNGLLSVTGGKFTTFRLIAEEAVDRMASCFPGKPLKRCQTAATPLAQDAAARAQTIRQWIAADPRLAEPLCPHHAHTGADVRWAVEQEMACTLGDLFWRRFTVGGSTCQRVDSLQQASQLMAKSLQWSDAERTRQIQLYQDQLAASRKAL